MRPAKEIKRLFLKSNVRVSSELDDRFINDALVGFEKSEKLKSDVRKANNWRIIINSRITKLAAAAVIVIAAAFVMNQLGVSIDGASAAWAEVVKALNEVENVHITCTITESDGTQETIEKFQWYIVKPDCLYEESPGRKVVDNGKERLTIDREKQTAQFSGSWMPYRPLEGHQMLEITGLFRSAKTKGYEFKKSVDESDETTLVYSVKFEKSYESKALVDAKTMLPLKMNIVRIKKMEDSQPGSREIEMLFNYEPIDDEIFAMVIPEGFTKLPYKHRGVISGKVVDETGQAVDDAVVYVVSIWNRFVEKGHTDQQGLFYFELAPEGVHKFAYMPVFIRAFSEDDPDRVAWTTINNPDECRNLGVEVPGEVGEIEFEGNTLKNATGIVIKMEPAARIFGKVMDTSGNALSNASVALICDLVVKSNYGGKSLMIQNIGGSGKRGSYVVQTNDEGHYEFTNLPRFEPNSYFTLLASYGGYVRSSSMFRVETPLESKQVDIKLFEAGLTIRGTLIDNYGQRLSARDVSAGATIDGFSASTGATTDENGEFTIEGAPVSENLTVRAGLAVKNNIPMWDKEKNNSYVYYPNVAVGIDYEQGKNEYEVEMVAERPELVLNVEVRNSAGEILQYFPVEIWDESLQISALWRADRLARRTDENGKCKFTEVPNVKGLKLVLQRSLIVPNEQLSDEVRKIVDQYNEKYFRTEVPVEIIEGQKEYNITVIALTHEENE